jgi:hypothetical protein
MRSGHLATRWGCLDEVSHAQQGGSGNNYRVINNHFSTVFYPTVGAYYPWVECEDEAQVTGNVFHESGRPAPF